MRLKQFINEDETFQDHMVEMIKRDCDPFLRTIAPIIGSGKCFVRRISQPVPSIIKKTTRTDRRPSDTGIEMHMSFDDAFMDKFGWRPRSAGVFTYPVKDVRMCHHGQHIFYPIGEFKFVYSPVIDDLYVALVSDDPEEEIERLLPSYTNKNLLGVFKGKFDGRNIYPEVMFKCKQYYLVYKNYTDKLMSSGVL